MSLGQTEGCSSAIAGSEPSSSATAKAPCHRSILKFMTLAQPDAEVSILPAPASTAAIPAQHCSEIMAAQQGNGDTASSIVVAQGRQVHLRNTPMTKFALIAAAAVALLATPAMS